MYQVEGTLTRLGKADTTSHITSDYAVYSMYEDKIYDHAITDLGTLDEITFDIRALFDNKQSIEDLISNL